MPLSRKTPGPTTLGMGLFAKPIRKRLPFSIYLSPRSALRTYSTRRAPVDAPRSFEARDRGPRELIVRRSVQTARRRALQVASVVRVVKVAVAKEEEVGKVRSRSRRRRSRVEVRTTFKRCVRIFYLFTICVASIRIAPFIYIYSLHEICVQTHGCGQGPPSR